MPRAQGPIRYIEHRTPIKDETGKYVIHPQFVNKDVYDFKDMKTGMRSHSQMSPTQFVAASTAIEDETLSALADGREVKIGDMFIVRPKVDLKVHKDADGKEYRKVFHEGDRIPASEVVCVGVDVRPTKAFVKAFLRQRHLTCMHDPWKGVRPQGDTAHELARITKYCQEHGFITVKNYRMMSGVSDYHARHLLDSFCEGEFPKMTKEKAGGTFVYRRIGV